MTRTVLMHANVQVPDEDGRATEEIVQAVQGALEVGSDDDTVRALEIVLAEEIGGGRLIRDPQHRTNLARKAAKIKAARGFSGDDVEIDDGAQVSHLDEEGPSQGAAWVQAWVFVGADSIEQLRGRDG
jgi:hypothetical protein